MRKRAMVMKKVYTIHCANFKFAQQYIVVFTFRTIAPFEFR